MREQKKNIALFPAHPSQIWILKQVADELSEYANIHWVIRDKDISLNLAEHLGIEYTTFTKAAEGILGNGIEVLKNIRKAIQLTREKKIDLWVSKYCAAHISSLLLRRKSMSFIDDDIELIPLVAWTSFPFANSIIAPEVTRTGRFDEKTIRFDGNFELFYLHPKRFSPDESIYDELGIEKSQPYAIIRLSALTAHHDVGMKGISREILQQVIDIAKERVEIFITSEKKLEPQFEEFRMPIPPHRIHHALAFAEFFLGDSQTMTSEAAVLGTPAFRISDFVGKISYVEELQKYGLAFGYKPDEGERLLSDIREIIANPDFKKEYKIRHKSFLDDIEDPLPIFVEAVKSLLG